MEEVLDFLARMCFLECLLVNVVRIDLLVNINENSTITYFEVPGPANHYETHVY